MAHSVAAYIGLGSNLDDPIKQIETAVAELNALPETRCQRVSRLYRSAPMGSVVQDDFINAVALLETSLSPEQLLVELQSLERGHQRVRKERWGPRTLDLDLLLYDNQTISRPGLHVPHPGLSERNFVLIPLYEIAPDLLLPDNQKLADLAQRCGHDGLECVN